MAAALRLAGDDEGRWKRLRQASDRLTTTPGGPHAAVRAEIVEAGFPLLWSEMPNRVAYSEAALYGTTPTAIGTT